MVYFLRCCIIEGDNRGYFSRHIRNFTIFRENNRLSPQRRGLRPIGPTPRRESAEKDYSFHFPVTPEEFTTFVFYEDFHGAGTPENEKLLGFRISMILINKIILLIPIGDEDQCRLRS